MCIRDRYAWFLSYSLWRVPGNTSVLSILFRQRGRGEKSLGKTGKRLPSEKKIANLLFCRYITPAFLSNTIYQRAGVRVVEWARLESVCTGNSTEGSNPSLSAINFPSQYIRHEYIAFFVCRGMGKKWGKLMYIIWRKYCLRKEKCVFSTTLWP